MKKKILLVLLVVLMVGILAFSVFACNKDDDKKKPNKDDKPIVDDEIDDTDYLTPMLQDVVGAIDNTIKGVTDIDNAASVSASIFVDVEVDGKTYNVALDIAGSIDKENENRNWAQIDANVLGVEVSLFAVNNGEVEDLYIAQNILNEEKQWNKLSQFEEANVLSNLACNGIINAVADLLDNKDKETGATVEQQINGGILNSLAGGMLGAVGTVGGALFVPGEGADVDFSTADGYVAGINVEGISKLLEGLGTILAKLPAEYHGIIETAVGILLGGELDLSAGTFAPGAAEKTPTIELAFGVKDDLFTGLEISYVLPDLSVEFGINNLSLKGTSASYDVPFSGEPKELAIALNLDLVAPGISAEAMNAQVNIYPNVAMTFKNDYVDFDFSKLYAVADLTIGEDVYTIAEYNVDGNEDLIFDLSSIVAVTGADVPATQFKVPVNIQEKFDKAMDGTKLNDQAKGYVAKVAEIDADETLSDDEKAKMKKKAYDGAVAFIIENTVYTTADVDEENTEVSIEDQKKALAKSALDGAIAAITGEASNAIKVNGKDKNVVDYVIEDIVPGLFNEDGSFNIGGIVGVLGQVGAIVEEIKPILETEGLFDAAIVGSTARATLNLEVLMDALLVEDGIIDGITGEWNDFDLWYYQPEVGHGEGEYGADYHWVVDIPESATLVENMTLAQILAPEAVIDNIVAFVNSAMYDNYLKNFVPATEGEEALGYIEYFDSAEAPVEFTKDMLTQAIAGLTGATLEEDDAYTNMSISVNGYAQDGIGFGLEATLGEEVKTLGFGLGLEIIENVAVEDYTQKIFFDETYGIGVNYDAEYNPVNTTIYNDTGKDGGKLLAYTALQLASEIVNFLPNYVDAPFEYVMMEGTRQETAYEVAFEGTTLTLNAPAGQTFYKFVLEADAIVVGTIPADSEETVNLVELSYSFVNPKTGSEMSDYVTLAGTVYLDEAPWYAFQTEGATQQMVPAGIAVYVMVDANAPVEVVLTLA